MLEIAGLVAKNTSGTEVEVTPSAPLPVSSAGYSSSATFTRPNDTNAYAAGDVISNGSVMNFAGIGAAGGRISIASAMLEIDVTSIPTGSGSFVLHLYSASPTAIADNAAYDLPSGDRTKYLGNLTLPIQTLFTSTCISRNTAPFLDVSLAAASSSLYGILQASTAYTPIASAVYKVTLNAVST